MVTRRVLCMLGVLGLALVAAVPVHLGASPHAAAAVAPRLPAAGVGALVVDEGRIATPRSPADALAAVADHHGVEAWLGSIATAVALTSGLPLVAAVADGDEQQADAQEQDSSGRLTSAVRAGDLDGDELDDVVVYDHDRQAGSLQLRALRGSDGALLWRVSTADDAALAFPLSADLDGDGRDDLLRYGLDLTVVDTAEGVVDASFTWTVGLVSGADGALRWTRTYQGHSRSHTSRSADTQTYEFTSTNLAVLPFLVDGADVLLDAIDLDLWRTRTRKAPLLVVADTERTSRMRSRTRVERRAGADGALMTESHTRYGSAVALLWPVGDLDGDGTEELLWQRSVVADRRSHCRSTLVLSECEEEGGQGAFVLEMLDGEDLAPRWSASAPTPHGFASPTGRDLTGDGVPDIVRFTVTLVDANLRFATAVVSGSDGQLAWERVENAWLTPLAYGPVGGGAAHDLLTVSVESDRGIVLRLDRVDGATGQTLLSSRYRAPGHDLASGFTSTLLYAHAGDDLDGDAVPELAAGSVTSASDLSGQSVPSSDVRVESGRTGRVAYEDAAPGVAFVLSPLTDVDGDGVDEWVRRQSRHDGETPAVTSTVVDVAESVDLWSWEGVVADAGDQDGLVGGELLAQSGVTVSSLDGRTGAVRWSDDGR